jgi:outer membrane protein assembly factor BamA
VGSWDGFLEADALADRRYRNFYGLGNETEIEDRNFFLARIGGISARPSLQKQLLPFTSARVGPSFEFTRVEPQTLNGSSVPTRFTAEDFQDKYYVGLEGEFHIDGTDTLAATEHGLRWLNSAAANVGVRNTRNAFVRLESELSYFYTFYNPIRVTLGLRFGGATNIGDFEFYQANTLGGRSNLRGYRTTRFAGHSMAFNNVDVRVQLLDFNVYVMRGIGGVLGFFDTGRVWAGGDDSDVWHTGYGGGIWIAPFNQVALTATMGFSPDDTLFDISMGFQF